MRMSARASPLQSIRQKEDAQEARMKPITIVGVLLIVLGVVALAYQGITYTTSEKVVDLGPLKVEAKRERTIPLPPVLGGIALIGGIVLVIVGARRKAWSRVSSRDFTAGHSWSRMEKYTVSR